MHFIKLEKCSHLNTVFFKSSSNYTHILGQLNTVTIFPIPSLCPDSNKFLMKDRQPCENSVGRSMRGIVGERQVGEGSRKSEK